MQPYERFWGLKAQVMRNPATTDYAPVTVTASATPHTKGAWAELIASTPWEVYLFDLYAHLATNTAGADTSTLLDIGIGTAGSEVVIAPDLQFGMMASPNIAAKLGYRLPLRIPSGVRVAARCQSTVVSKTVALVMDIYGGGIGSPVGTFQKCRAIGVVAASSKGTDIATPGSGHTKSAYTTLEASVAESIRALSIGPGGKNATAYNAGRGFIDIAVGDAGSEQIIVPDMYFETTTSESMAVAPPGRFYPLIHRIPVGARLSARFQQSANQGLDLILYAFS